MQGTTLRRVYQLAGLLLYGLAVVSILGLALLGQMPATAAGWLVQPPVVAGGRARCVRRGVGCGDDWGAHVGAAADYLGQSWRPVLLRSLVLWGLWGWSDGWGPVWLRLVPWGLWLWRSVGVGWPGLGRKALWQGVEQMLWQGQRLVLVGYVGLICSQMLVKDQARCYLGLSCVVGATLTEAEEGVEPQVAVVRTEEVSYQVTLQGHFTLAVPGDHPFRMRLLILFLSLLDVPGMARGSRRTRDGRMPFVRQEQLAAWFDVPQPHISRWLRYWHAANWADLLSLRTVEVLTAELRQRIVEVCATFPDWGLHRVYQYLREQGVAVTEPQVQETAEESGCRQLQQTLRQRYELTETTCRLREGWLVAQLLTQLRDLLARLEAGERLTAEMPSTCTT